MFPQKNTSDVQLLLRWWMVVVFITDVTYSLKNTQRAEDVYEAAVESETLTCSLSSA